MIVIFDLDGTLTDTVAVDDQCFAAAIRTHYGDDAVPASWAECPDVTDSGIARWIHQRQHRRLPSPVELERFKATFIDGLRGQLRALPERFQPIPGAVQLLSLLAEKRIHHGIATGGWPESAQMKIQAAGLPPGRPLATSEDANSRADVFSVARQRVEAQHGTSSGAVVLLGDGLWDLQTARALGWSFIGRGTGEAAERLRADGASLVLADFTDPPAVLAAIRGLAERYHRAP